ncbi:MAG: transglutaminaseTgpA domain-containing protein [Opitutales bacterium]
MSTLEAEKSGRLSLVEFHQVRWLLGQTLGLVSLWSAAHLEFVSIAYFIGFFAVVSLVTLFPGIPARLPKVFWMLASPMLLMLVIVDFVMNRGMPLQPLVRMVMLLLLLRCLQYRTRREDLQLVLLGLFLTVVGGVLSVSLGFALQLLIFTPIAMALLFVLSLMEPDTSVALEGKDWNHHRWSTLARNQWRALDLRLIALTSLVLVVIAGLTALLFLMIPRIQMDNRLSFLQGEGQGTIGFSERLQFGEISQLSKDESPAMRVEGPSRESLSSTPYWRMIVMDHYIDNAFQVSNSAQTAITYTDVTRYDTYQYERGSNLGRSDNWDFYLEGGVSRYLPILGPFRSLKLDSPRNLQVNPTQRVYRVEPLPSNVLAYRLEGMTATNRIEATNIERLTLGRLEPGPSPLDDTGRPASVEYPDTLVMLPLREADRAFLENAVEEITGGQPIRSPQSFAHKASIWLAKRHQYSLETDFQHNRDEGDYIVQWMRSDSDGWCEHFTGSFILLARTAGFPARAVAGFRGATWNEFEEYFVVRNSAAHAWAEIYDGDGHWLRVDPTPGAEAIASAGIEGFSYDMAVDQGWQAWIDSLRIIWYRSVVNFDSEDQDELADSVSTWAEAFWLSLKQVLAGYWEQLNAWLTRPWTQERMLSVALALLTISGLLFALTRVNRIATLLTAYAPRILRRGGSTRGGRRRSGKWLRRLQVYRSRVGALSPEWADDFYATHAALLEVRYGDPRLSERALTRLFAQARRLHKRCQALPRPTEDPCPASLEGATVTAGANG